MIHYETCISCSIIQEYKLAAQIAWIDAQNQIDWYKTEAEDLRNEIATLEDQVSTLQSALFLALDTAHSEHKERKN